MDVIIISALVSVCEQLCTLEVQSSSGKNGGRLQSTELKRNKASVDSTPGNARAAMRLNVCMSSVKHRSSRSIGHRVAPTSETEQQHYNKSITK